MWVECELHSTSGTAEGSRVERGPLPLPREHHKHAGTVRRLSRAATTSRPKHVVPRAVCVESGTTKPHGSTSRARREQCKGSRPPGAPRGTSSTQHPSAWTHKVAPAASLSTSRDSLDPHVPQILRLSRRRRPRNVHTKLDSPPFSPSISSRAVAVATGFVPPRACGALGLLNSRSLELQGMLVSCLRTVLRRAARERLTVFCRPPVDREDPGPVSSLTATTTTSLESALHHARLPPLHSLSPRSRNHGAATLTTYPPASTRCRPHRPSLTLSQPELCVRHALGPPKSQHLGIGEVLVRCSVPYHDTLLVSNCEVSEQAEQPSSDCRHLGTDDTPEGRGARTASTWMSTMHTIPTDRE
ncbi:hypothetical protein CERSUDRAFT_96359 [Gelatoporia subvermispora B]|uniref:Uncharacterized protein n=1 Tax=Ceriporiopsis subvermispora (strain B) TaxID=914234 RepID=M2PIX8_CERS8|nr:hypothetical protein CERSUDRAFT_96359 [Gelatoporia subvermispora B]